MVDLTHAVPAQDVAAGAFHLASAYAYFPPGTIHLAIVDPGVGSARRAVAVAAGGYYWVAPDNGLLGYAFAALAAAGHLQGRWQDGHWQLGDDARAVELTEPRYWLPDRQPHVPWPRRVCPGGRPSGAGRRAPRARVAPPRAWPRWPCPRPSRLADGWQGDRPPRRSLRQPGHQSPRGAAWRAVTGSVEIAGRADRGPQPLLRRDAAARRDPRQRRLPGDRRPQAKRRRAIWASASARARATAVSAA